MKSCNSSGCNTRYFGSFLGMFGVDATDGSFIGSLEWIVDSGFNSQSNLFLWWYTCLQNVLCI